MYTQCPDCSTAFRVTAGVLKQAGGKVRCGGCGSAFNALEYLSEDKPAQPAKREAEVPLPELTPEPVRPGDEAPASISAEQSAALLKTLDELAGSDIRIEDTGVEWRVLDEDAMAESLSGDALTDSYAATNGGEGAIIVDELLDESPTPVDQFLTKTPNDIEASEIFADSAVAETEAPFDELRFDDDTPLPDDFDGDDETPHASESLDTGQPGLAPEDDDGIAIGQVSRYEESPTDVALSDADEWADILDEFAEPLEAYEQPVDAGLVVPEGSDSNDPDDDMPAAPGPTESPPDVDTQFALQAEAMGIDLSGIHAQPDDEDSERSPDVTDEPEEARDIDFGDETSDEASEVETGVTDLAAASASGDETDGQAEPDLNAETGDQPELELLDESGEAPAPDLSAETGDQPGMDLLEEHDAMVQPDVDEQGVDEVPTAFSSDSEEDSRMPIGSGSGDAEPDVRSPVDDDDLAPLEFGSIEKQIADLGEQSDVFDKDFFETSAEGHHDAGGEASPGDGDGSEHYVPPPTEEEQTLNRLIDQDLLSFAIEDEDGFASTIIIPEKDAAAAHTAMKSPPLADDSAEGFESIVMEGEFVRSALDAEKYKADIAAAAELAQLARAAQPVESSTPRRSSKRGMVAAAMVLTLLLGVQAVHQSREALATIPAINEAIAPLYRAIGKPLSPTWDVTGWRFEARRDVLDDDANTLTVISRIGNTSTRPLPYPQINVTLTDRFEETIGNKTLDPVDYLADGLDPGTPVQPGTNFTAVLTIDSPSEEATGYKLQACYRLPDTRLRCHVPDFK